MVYFHVEDVADVGYHSRCVSGGGQSSTTLDRIYVHFTEILVTNTRCGPSLDYYHKFGYVGNAEVIAARNNDQLN